MDSDKLTNSILFGDSIDRPDANIKLVHSRAHSFDLRVALLRIALNQTDQILSVTRSHLRWPTGLRFGLHRTRFDELVDPAFDDI